MEGKHRQSDGAGNPNTELVVAQHERTLQNSFNGPVHSP
jgi:hypothetical protein